MSDLVGNPEDRFSRDMAQIKARRFSETKAAEYNKKNQTSSTTVLFLVFCDRENTNLMQ